jgi:hypothetical protein
MSEGNVAIWAFSTQNSVKIVICIDSTSHKYLEDDLNHTDIYRGLLCKNGFEFYIFLEELFFFLYTPSSNGVELT